MIDDGNLSVSGSLTATNLSYKPWHLPGRFDGVNLVVLSSKGEYSYAVARPASYPIGSYTMSWSQSHLDGTNYVSCCSREKGVAGMI